MKRVLLIILLLSLAASVTAADRRPRKKKRNKTEAAAPAAQPAEKQVAPKAVTAPEPEPELLPDPPIDDMTLGLTAAQADSLVAVWRERQRQETFSDFFAEYILSDTTNVEDRTPDSVYTQRLRDLVSPVQLPYNEIVKQKIGVYTRSRYGLMSRILGMSQYYFPIIESELIKEKLPVELRALPIIESALIPTAVSPVGATGLWQFMPTTGKSYGLEINSIVDERRDPVRATQAACRFLKDLYSIYNDWPLAIAAYNCGPGNVNKAIARSGGKTFWEIYDYLPRETRGYVPAFIGATYAYAYHRQHGIELAEAPIPLAVDTIRINRLMHLEQIASTINITMETLRQLNPQYKMDIIPATTKPYTLTLPTRMVSQYIAHEAEIYAKDSTYLKDYLNPANLDKKRKERPAGSYTYYTVKRGDTLGVIARRYRTTTTQIMRWNGLKSAHKVRIGQRLRIQK